MKNVYVVLLCEGERTLDIEAVLSTRKSALLYCSAAYEQDALLGRSGWYQYRVAKYPVDSEFLKPHVKV